MKECSSSKSVCLPGQIETIDPGNNVILYLKGTVKSNI